MYVLRTDIPEGEYANAIGKFEKTVTESGGQVLNTTDEWGVRNLAYETKHHTKGYFVLMEFTGTPEQLKRLEERLKLDDHVLRYQIVRNQ